MNPDICASHHRNNPESAAANERTNKSRDRQRIVAYLEGFHGPSTCDEIERALGMSHQTASARVSELLRDGVIERTGAKRATRTGSMAAVLRIRKPLADAVQVALFGERA